MSLIDLLNTQQGISDDIAATGSSVQTATVTPVNAVAAAVTILATEVARMNNTDTIVFDDVTLTKAAATDAAAGEFLNIAGIRDCVDELLGTKWATSGTTNAILTSKIKGSGFNGKVAVNTVLEDTTADFATGVTASTATIAAGTLAVLAAGDTITFDDVTYTKVASGATGNEFTTAASLITLLDALTDWGAADSGGDIVITAAVNDVDFDGYEIVVVMNRATENGVNGTVARAKTIVSDDDYLYVAISGNTTADGNWRRVALGSAF